MQVVLWRRLYNWSVAAAQYLKYYVKFGFPLAISSSAPLFHALIGEFLSHSSYVIIHTLADWLPRLRLPTSSPLRLVSSVAKQWRHPRIMWPWGGEDARRSRHDPDTLKTAACEARRSVKLLHTTPPSPSLLFLYCPTPYCDWRYTTRPCHQYSRRRQ